ncbi:MAG: T9SS type A sorting domain-containing protein [Bacteroidales bacterium]|nr:T9SS type A sorting domain-containing protein [Bacteroidales bacterium]
MVKIWPNPASDHITIEKGDIPLWGQTYISIYDISGRELIKVADSDRIDITSLPKGIYIVITSHNGKTVGYNRLIKSK